MEQRSRGPSIKMGILMGLLTSISVIVVTYFVQQVSGLPYPPFALFDFMTRVLPGAFLHVTVDTMVGIIVALNLGSTSTTAKLTEQAIALVQFAVLGGVLGGVLAAIRRRRDPAPLPIWGLVLGLILAAAFAGVEVMLGFPDAGPVATIAWLVVVFGGWGLALGWLLRELRRGAATSALHRLGSGGTLQGLSRREALTLLGTAVVALIASAVGLGFLLSKRQPTAQATPGAITPVPGQTSGAAASPPESVLAARIQPAPGTRMEITPNADFYRVDINTLVSQVDAATWRLEVSGLVDHPMTFTLDDIRALPSVSQYITLQCISNPIGGDLTSTTLYTGVRLMDLAKEVGLQPAAVGFAMQSADNYFETVVLEAIMDERTLLVYAMNGEPLPSAHGFPLRLYIPGRYGMKQPKWIVRLEAVASAQPGYWVRRGWSERAAVRTTSVIDDVTVPQSGMALLGGIGYSGDLGISKVEVQVDEGPWTEAELRAPALSPLTWVQWRAELPVPAGNHVARVRAYDGSGTLQIVDRNGSYPDGATGTDSFNFSV
jgi:DMSO/TMAO reductase YedYZ molybdopterin-dependent catalytic subunit